MDAVLASDKKRAAMAAGLIAAAGAAAYATSFAGAFQYDDIPAILQNPTVERVWPLRIPLAPPAGALTVSGRPLLNLTFALNHAISGERPWSYHALNLLIHVLAGVLLYGIARRTLARRRPADPAAAGRFALALALLWTLHPLQTEAVTYVVQRAESLMGLFYLLTLYGFIRGVGGDSRRWFLLSGVACFLGTATKEVIVTAPLLVLLYDRTFIAGGWAAAWRARRGYYLALAASWLPLAAWVAGTGGNRGGTSGFNLGVNPWLYWRSQAEAVARYVQLSVWPHPLIFDYGFQPERGGAVHAALLALVGAALAATVIGCWRGRPWGFLGGWFFLILAPTSLVPGTIQYVVEHRMYLPLAAVLAAAGWLAAGLLARLGGGAIGSPRFPWKAFAAGTAGLALAAGVATARRNAAYRTDLSLWGETVAQRPGSPTAQSNLGRALWGRGRTAEAIAHYRLALRLAPLLPTAHYNLGLALDDEGRMAEALAEYEAAFTVNPRLFYARFRAGRDLYRLGRLPEAEQMLRAGLEEEPAMSEGHLDRGLVLAGLGRRAEAVAEYRRALEIDPRLAEAEADWGVALADGGDPAGAGEHFRRALALDPREASVHFDWGVALARAGQTDAAADHYASAVRLRPDYAEANLNLGVALAELGRVAEALPPLQAAVRLAPGSAAAHGNLAAVLDQAGRLPEAVAEYRRALALEPDYAEARSNLGNALARLARGPSR